MGQPVKTKPATRFVRQLGIIAYGPAHDLQMALVNQLHRDGRQDVCLLLQHEPVFTLGVMPGKNI